MKSLPRKRRERGGIYAEKDVASFTEATGLLPALPYNERDRRELLSFYSIQSMSNWTGQPR
ncbi:MAG: hypothetical protein IJC54_04555 [Clostridia bacterium]|nr:hypothetical protein [Clostridia bacterium]